jgi:hypothetical protein
VPILTRRSELAMTVTAGKRRGPRGGTTTQTAGGMVRKNFWIAEEEYEALREKAFRERRSEASILRQGLRLALGFSEPPAGEAAGPSEPGPWVGEDVER